MAGMIPAPPPGFLLDGDPKQPATLPPPPTGFVLDQADAPGRGPSLLDRARINAEQSFAEGTLAGQVVSDAQSRGGTRELADAADYELARRRGADPRATGMADLPPDPAAMRAIASGSQATIRGMSDADLERYAVEQRGVADAARADFQEKDAARRAEFDALPEWSGPAEGAAALLGQIAGGIPTPENLIPVGRASTVPRTLAKGAAANAGVSAAVEPVIQVGNIQAGRQEAPDVAGGAAGVAISALIGGVLNVTPEMSRAIGGRVARLFGKPEAEVSAEEVARAVQTDPETRDLLRSAGATDEQISAMSDPAKMAERVQARRANEAVRAQEGAQPLTTTTEATAQAKADAEATRKAELAARKAPAELTPEQLAEARAAGEQPPPPRAPDTIEAGPPVRTGAGAPEATTARPAGTVDPGLDAGIARARGDDIGARIDEDPEVLVQTQLGIPAETYRTLPAEARERVVAAAQRQRTAEAPAPARATSDAAIGDGQYSPATRPQQGAGEAGRGRQPTTTEIDAGGQPYARTATGTADRPTRLDSDSSGMDFATRDPETGRPRDERAARFEDRAYVRASAERMSSVADLLREWEQRSRSRRADSERGYSTGDARSKYEGAKASGFSPKTGEPGTDGRYATDEFGFVASDKGGPVKFKDQKQAARWVLSQGHKRSPDQIFEIDNHPSGNGFTVRERGRSETNTNAGGQDGNGARDTGTTAGRDGRAVIGERVDRPDPAAVVEDRGRGDGAAADRREQGDDARGMGRGDGNAPGRDDRVRGPDPRGEDAPGGRVPQRPARSAPAPDREPGVSARVEGGTGEVRGDDGRDAAGGSRDAPEADAGNGDRAPRKERSVTLNSGVDPAEVGRLIGKPFAATIGKEAAAATKDAIAVRRLLKASTANSSPIRALTNVAGYVANSNRGQMFMLRDRYSGEAKKIMGEVIDKIATDPGSGRKVGQVYEEAVNQKTFNLMNRMGNIVGKDKLGDLAFATEVGDILAGRAKRGSEAAQTVAKRLRGILDEVHAYAQDAGLELGYAKDYFPRMLDSDAVRKDGAEFEADAIKVYRKIGLSEKDAKQAALDWRERELGVGAMRFGQQGPLSDFTKGRKLPPEADEMMAKWYNRDAFETLSSYYRNVTRKVEFTRRFGKNGADLDKAFDGMIRAGVDPADLAYLRTAIDSSLGLLNGNGLSPVGSAVAWVQTVGILRMLPRAVWSSIAEPFAYGVRTGNALDGLKAFAGTWEEIFRGKSLDDHRDAAEFMGVVGDAMTHMVLAGQFGGGQASRLNNALLARFFTRSGLQPLTEAQRLAGVKIGHDFLARLVRDAGGEGKRTASAKLLLADLGVADGDVAAMAKFLGKAEGRAPKVADLMGDSPAARQYMAAILRFVDESIQNPKAVDRPAAANHPVGRLAYGIMSFMYTYTRNVTYRVGKQAYRAATDKDLTLADRATLALGPGMALAVLGGMQMGVASLRDRLTNSDEAEERPKELSIVQYASRAGALGNLDPLVNGVLGAKYERDLTALIAGPYVGQYLQDGQKLVGLIPEPIGKNSPNTNSAEWNAWRAVYNAVVVPSVAAGLALAPGGPVLNKAYGALIASPFGPIGGPATAPLSPQAASDFATFLTGERVRRWSKGKDPEGRTTGRGSGGRTTGRD
ncbi:hypothetical protein T8K17_11195 [Thalassobaculum sp. OXR-137]|uniref:hypothetical protein n=1 Tax=Thalassobaculum sp. OXR-137 TaxID=3100173 RepID=UPI002AC8F8F1|nr:hypothetical protein [Thalassobaculum sp. OXR-137]WPZ36700.1 hypothetical protein T8K17_11195 [Thalassobaculum sp. OXR-137]